ncbi:hypothetical protein HGRIS_005527 [Hohenbuehelia grisea]|uniref:intramembrane prenyl-peptidase Rce1 n=1 Tax=Hohenbuehelia grisea TaxID=104357 RepID=A0ABR3JY89_9AGAR
MASASFYFPLSSSSAHLLVSFFGMSYVGSLYLTKYTRLSFRPAAQPPQSEQDYGRRPNDRGRDDLEVIQARLVAVTAATILNCLVVFWTIRSIGRGISDGSSSAVDVTTAYLGLKLPTLSLESIYPHLLAPILFIGPLYAHYLFESLPFQRKWNFQLNVVDQLFSWIGIRNYFMAPITEELVFRSCVLSVYHLAGVSRNKLIFLAPLAFGFAHVHHAWENYNRLGRTPAAAKRAIFMSLFQLAYTTLFGFYTSYVFLRTGSIYPAISSHIFCNFMGVPQLGYELSVFPTKKIALWITYFAGIIGFFWNLSTYTRSSSSIYWTNTSASL